VTDMHRELERILSVIHQGGEHKAAVVVLVNTNDQMETAAMGIDNEKALFEVLYSVTNQLAATIYAGLPENDRRPTLVYPTLEQAKHLGMRIQRNGKN
jgi:hypothetical protein